MATQNTLIMKILRLITPEEVSDIATKHNGGKFLSLTDLVNERVEHKIYRDFATVNSMEEILDAHNKDIQAKILPFKKTSSPETALLNEIEEENVTQERKVDAPIEAKENHSDKSEVNIVHAENENMSSFILIEKARLKRSQQILKQKEIIDLYQKNSNVEVEQIKNSNADFAQDCESGVLVNKKQY